MKPKKIFAVVLNWNNKNDTLECLSSLEKVQVPKNYDFDIVLVDNGSTDGSVDATRHFPKIQIIENAMNLGFSEGNNRGIEYSLRNGAFFVLVLNNDTLVETNFLENILKPFGKDSQIGVVVPKIYFAKGYEFHRDRYKKEDLGKVIWYAGGKIDWQNIYGIHIGVDEVDRGQFEKEKEVEFASGCCFMAKREVFEKVGFFDPRYFLYLEDMDFSFRVKKTGFKIIYNPKTIIWHKNAQTAGGSGSKLQDYYITRNRLIFGLKYASFRTKFALFREAIINSFKNETKRKAFFDFITGRFGKGEF